MQLLRDPARPRRHAQPPRERRARRDPAPRRAGSPRDRPHRGQPRLLPRPRRRLHARAARPRGGRDPGARTAPPLVDRGQPRQRRPRRRLARDADRCPPSARAAPVGRRRSASRDGSPLHRRRRTCASSSRWRTSTSPPDVIVGFPAEDERRVREHAARRRAGPADEAPRLSVFAEARHEDGRRRHRARRGQEGAERAPARAVPACACRRALAREGRPRRRRARRPARAAATATTTRRGSCAARSAISCASARRPSRRRGSSLPDDCLFCRLTARATTCTTTDGFVALRRHQPAGRHAPARDPRAARRHVPRRGSLHRRAGAGECSTSSPRRRESRAWRTTRSSSTSAPGAGQTVFHLHWHVLGGRIRGLA